MSAAVLHVLCGLPGAGKSTLALRLAHAARSESFAAVSVHSADAVRTERLEPARVFQELRRAVESALERGGLVIVDSCALRAHERTYLLALGRRAYARCELVLVTTHWQTCIERDRARGPRASLVDWPSAMALFELTRRVVYVEGWDIVRCVDGSDGAAT